VVAELGAAHVIGVDSSEAMIAEARSAGDCEGRIEYRVADVTAMTPQGEFTKWAPNSDSPCSPTRSARC
jgi:trans-aconitate methyltransferase